jgi:iron complex transport system permease protein
MKLNLPFIFCLCCLSILLIAFGVIFPFDINLWDINNPIGLEILLYLRFPRIIMAWLAGASLSIAGYLIQILVKNPLADPYLLGTASGATLGANLFLAGMIPTMGCVGIITPLFAFLGALAITFLVVSINNSLKYQSTLTMVLIGLAVSTLTGAVTTVLIYLSAEANKLRSLVFWALGSFERADWVSVIVLAISLLFSIVVVFNLQSALLVLSLGRDKSKSLGLDYKKLSTLIIIISSLLTAIVVSYCGIIGFVGLVIPHMIRSWIGSNNKFSPILLALLGGCVMCLADLLSRLLYPPAGLPVGAVSSLIGAPFFVYLLLRSYNRDF